MADELAGLNEEVRLELQALADHVPPGDGSVAFHAISRRLLRLAQENAELKEDAAICREAVEDAVRFVDYVDSYNDDDTQAAGRRCTKRRLSEAMGKACPRLLHERPEGQKFYGLHYKELRERAERAEAELAALKEHLSDVEENEAAWMRRAKYAEGLIEAAPKVKVRGKVGEVCTIHVSHDLMGKRVALVPVGGEG